jgi:basic membrane protein A and related proteins
MRRFVLALFAPLLLALSAAACGGDDGGGDGNGDAAGGGATDTGGGGEGGREPIKVGFMYIGPPGDAGWTFSHDEGRKYLEENVDGVETTFLDSVPEANSGPAIDQLIAQGNKVIFGTSFGYGDTVIQKAQQHPDVVFEHATGFQRSENVATYFVQHWEPSFLLGVMAGHMTKSNTLGYVGTFPIPEVIRDANAFTMGARSVNPDAKVKIVFISTWFDPPKEKQAAKSLLDAGADVLFGISDSPSVLEEAAANGAYAATWNSDMKRFGPEAYLSSVELNWGPYYEKRIEAVRAGDWKSHDYWGTLADGDVKLSQFGDNVPEEVQAEVEEKLAGFKDGSFKPFMGPIKDQSGKVQIEDGKESSFEQWVGMTWLVEGIEGKLPG